MSYLPRLILFVAVALTIVTAAHYYLWLRLVRDVKLPVATRRALTAVLATLLASLPLTFWLSRTLPPDRGRGLLLVLYCWFGFLFLLLLLLGVSDLGRALARGVRAVRRQPPQTDPDRRLTLARIIAGSVAVLAGGTGTAAVALGTAIRVRELRIALPRLPTQLSGLSIAHLTDLHVGPTLRRPFVEEVVRQTNALQPDVIAITGDLVDGSVERLSQLVEPLRGLRARHGVFFVTGNHEYYSEAEPWCQKLTELGIRVLRNERVGIGDERGGFDLAGVDDWEAHRFGHGHGADLPKALAGRDPTRAVVLLAHQPRAALEANDLGVGLVLAGHTHGGQIWPWKYLVYLQQPVVSGLGRIGQTLVSVSNGTGYWGPPMRLGIPAEIVKVVLERRSAQHSGPAASHTPRR